MVRDLLQKAIEMAGSEAKLGALTGYSQNAIWQAKRRGRVTPEMALALDRATNGVVSKEKLRPDLWPSTDEAA